MFLRAKAVWCEQRMAQYLVFRQKTGSLAGTEISIAAADFYRLRVNGEFVAFGPARTAKGYARVDRFDLSRFNGTENIVEIEVAGYRCKSLSTVLQDSFLRAEITRGEALYYTGRDFTAYTCPRMRETMRFSVQRHFAEIYDTRDFTETEVAVFPLPNAPQCIARQVPLADTPRFDLEGAVNQGTFTANGDDYAGRVYSFDPEQMEWGCFPKKQVPFRPLDLLQLARQDYTGKTCLPVTLTAGQWVMMDVGRISVGFVGISAEAHQESDILVAFSEEHQGDTFTFTNIHMQSVLEYLVPSGKLETESFEPYSFARIAVFVKSGSVTLQGVHYRAFERNQAEAIQRDFHDDFLNRLYRTALRTFAHNAVDLYTDCPSRERAGWLCDSFFSARAEHYLYGSSPVEKAFLENYVLYQNQGEYPDGALPMCYPSHDENHKFIPQWDMWYVLEVCEYLEKREVTADKEYFRPSVEGVLRFLSRYENEEGLLEKLPSWNFVEWSDANRWTQDVNFPTNFLYVGVLGAVARVFDRPELADKAEALCRRTIELSFDGEVFVDNAEYIDGKLTPTRNVSEAGQYYALFFGGIRRDDQRFARLTAYVEDHFASFEAGERNFCPITVFIGFYMRLLVLLEWQDKAGLRESIESFCTAMVENTDTLWEYRVDQLKGSRDHGFASFVVLALDYIAQQ